MDNKKIKVKLDQRLKHLTNKEIETLISRYYADEKIKDLLKEYKIDINPSRLYSIFPPQISKDKICPNCGIPLLISRPSKSSYSINKNNEYCSKCNHINDASCSCEYCKEQKELFRLRQEEEKKKIVDVKRNLIYEHYGEKSEPINIEWLSLTQRTYLGALLRLALDENMQIINPLDNIDQNLGPTANFTNEIFKELSKNNIITVSPESPISAFVESPLDNEFPNVYYIYRVMYNVNINMNDNYYEKINDLINPKEILDDEKDEAFLLWKRIALEECLEYLYFQMNKVGFDFNAGEKTIAVLNDLLEHFSTSQIYGIIYRSIANATKWYQESNISKRYAANSVIGRCQRYGERAIIGKWDLSKYSRITDCQESMLSEFFFNRVIGIGILGFHVAPVSL